MTREAIKVACLRCGTVNAVRKSQHLRGWGNYCNMDCKKGLKRERATPRPVILPMNAEGRLLTRPLRKDGYE